MLARIPPALCRKRQAPKAFPLSTQLFFPLWTTRVCPNPAPKPVTMEYQRFMTFQKNLFDIYIHRLACAPATATVPAPSRRRLSIRCGSRPRSFPLARLVYFPSCSLGQWGIKLPRLAFGRSRSALTDKAMVEAPPLLCLYDFGIRLTYSQEQ